MRIALCSSFVPFVSGGYRNIVEWLGAMLEAEGHQVELVYLPQFDQPDLLFQQMAAYRWVDLSAADRVICFRPPAHFIPHPRKILWFIHHVRQFYDLWDSEYRGFPGDAKHEGIRSALVAADNAALAEAGKIFTNSKIVAARLKRYNSVDSEVLYPPVFAPERFHCRQFNDEIVYICRMEHHKRQHLLIEAMRHTRTRVRLRLSGKCSGEPYAQQLRSLIKKGGLSKRVILEDRWISEEEKIDRLANCLAAAYLPLDEDSYGYPTLEASHAGKAILSTTDSGGVLELVENGVNGLVVEPTPAALGAALDALYCDKAKAMAMGRSGSERISQLNVSWSHVVERLLA